LAEFAHGFQNNLAVIPGESCQIVSLASISGEWKTRDEWYCNVKVQFAKESDERVDEKHTVVKRSDC
jgi:hypothetical protein